MMTLRKASRIAVLITVAVRTRFRNHSGRSPGGNWALGWLAR